MESFFSLRGKVALVTGGTSGIGFGMIKGLASAKVEQIILTYRSESKLQKAKEGIAAVNPAVLITGVFGDFSEKNEDKLVNHIASQAFEYSKTGRIDILINNAGINNRIQFSEFPQDKFDEVLRVDLNIPVKLTKKVGMKMLENKHGGAILFTASLCSFQGGVDSTAYAIAKGGIKQFVAALSNEWSLKGIRINAIAPGYIITNLTDQIEVNYRNSIISRIPIGRWGNIDDFQGPAIFLCSEASRYITGETLVIDGGWLNY